jgi:integrase
VTENKTRTRDHRVHLKNYRSKLPARREPYWRQIDAGRYIGFRKTETGSETWIARWTDDDSKFHYQAIGSVAAFDWSGAKGIAERWFDQCEAGVVRAGTVEEACKAYVEDRRVQVSERNARDAEKRFKANVYGTKLARTKLDKLRSTQLTTWRDELLAKSTPEYTKRTGKTLYAALNYAFRERMVRSNDEWKRVSMNVGGERPNELDFYWTVEQRRAFLEVCANDIRNLLMAICYTGARPQEIASAVVEDFAPDARILVLRHRKGYRSREKARAFSLSNDTALAFFRAQAGNREPTEPLLTREDGSGWYSAKGHGAWVAQVKRVRREHGFDDRVTAYHFRHWTITDWLNAGIVAANVATIAGTSISMIDSYYKKFIKARVDDQLKALVTI